MNYEYKIITLKSAIHGKYKYRITHVSTGEDGRTISTEMELCKTIEEAQTKLADYNKAQK